MPHASRLDRKGINEPTCFGSHEELVAEMGATFLSSRASIEHATIEASASYLASWIRKLKGDSRRAVKAAGAAQARKQISSCKPRHTLTETCGVRLPAMAVKRK